MLFLPHPPNGTLTFFAIKRLDRLIQVIALQYCLQRMWSVKNIPINWVVYFPIWTNQPGHHVRLAMVWKIAPRPRAVDMASMLRNLVETMKRHPGRTCGVETCGNHGFFSFSMWNIISSWTSANYLNWKTWKSCQGSSQSIALNKHKTSVLNFNYNMSACVLKKIHMSKSPCIIDQDYPLVNEHNITMKNHHFYW
jgi:hypothetical protein